MGGRVVGFLRVCCPLLPPYWVCSICCTCGSVSYLRAGCRRVSSFSLLDVSSLISVRVRCNFSIGAVMFLRMVASGAYVFFIVGCGGWDSFFPSLVGICWMCIVVSFLWSRRGLSLGAFSFFVAFLFSIALSVPSMLCTPSEPDGCFSYCCALPT